jgi:hypothetical protein
VSRNLHDLGVVLKASSKLLPKGLELSSGCRLGISGISNNL